MEIHHVDVFSFILSFFIFRLCTCSMSKHGRRFNPSYFASLPSPSDFNRFIVCSLIFQPHKAGENLFAAFCSSPLRDRHILSQPVLVGQRTTRVILATYTGLVLVPLHDLVPERLQSRSNCRRQVVTF
jgi:hypothetical protein